MYSSYNNSYCFILFILSICIYGYVSGAPPSIVAGEDWSIPSYVKVADNAGFFSENAAPNLQVNTPVFDLAWKQVNPSQGVFQYDITATVKGMDFDTFANQNKTKGPFWFRLWNSGDTWAPDWIKSYCNVQVIGKDYDNEYHLPIFNDCVWGEIKKVFRQIFLVNGMRSDPRLKFVYVPGAFNWCEFDFDIIGNYSKVTGYSYASFNTWFQQAMQDLVYIFNGENNDPSDDYAYKLVYTGEDFPFDVDNWPTDRNFLARDAVSKGMGIRTGITELSNFHLSQIPAYGYYVDNNGYLVLNNSWPLQKNPNRVIATENECYTDCGFSVSSNNLFYAIKMSNLKAIQMGVNWLYVVASKRDSYLQAFWTHWNWVLNEIGRQPDTAFDAWVSLRAAQDTFWVDSSYPLNWNGKPWIKNYERFLTQRDVSGAYTVPGTTQYKNILDPSNGIAFEGRKTQLANGNNSIAFYIQDDFISPSTVINSNNSIQIKVTYLDNVQTSWILNYMDSNQQLVSTDQVTQAGTFNNLTTATFTISDAIFKNGVSPGSCDFKLTVKGSNDPEIWFVRVIKMSASSSSTSSSTTSSTTSSATSSSTSTTSSTTGGGSSSTTGVNGSLTNHPSYILIISILLFIYFNI